MRRTAIAVGLLVLTQLIACSESPESTAPRSSAQIANIVQEPLRQAYFGDLHLHTALSVDAFITQTRTMPDDAYRYAKGEAIDHVSGQKIQLKTPLDFLAVTDHGELIGVAAAMADPDNALSELPIAKQITSPDYEVSQGAFREIVAAAAAGKFSDLIPTVRAALTMRDAWQKEVAAAEAHYVPGKFTTFVAYEWSSMPNLANLHRNIIFRGTDVPMLPFTSADSTRPEDLWKFLDDWREDEGDVLAIPHNSNASKGLMFPLQNSDGLPIDAAYATQRMRNEPIVEITQFKGTSEVHPTLSPNDEWADFEIWNTTVGAPNVIEPDAGGYVRNAYERGLQLEAKIGVNPYKFGLIGSSDSHDSSTAVEENNFTGGHGNADKTPEVRLNSKPSTLVLSSLAFSASGLAGVWAESNTRESIFDALRRKETFGTSGPHIRVRFFAGADYPADLAASNDAVAKAYAGGVPMGADLLLGKDATPEFFAWAARDPMSAPLQRLQIVKGWLDDEGTHEQVFDVACADGARPDASTHRCPASDASVDLSTCTPSADKGAGELSVVWSDPGYRAGERTFYYARVIENPTCRWSTWDAIRLGVPPPTSVPSTLQERAWSSPIWIYPAS
jgi:hypothetical protein